MGDKEAAFEWKSDFGTAKPDLGLALGLKYIRDYLKEAELSHFGVHWNDECKAFIIVGSMNDCAPLATAIVFGDLETLQNGTPEAMADLFESRVMNAVNSLEVQLLRAG